MLSKSAAKRTSVIEFQAALKRSPMRHAGDCKLPVHCRHRAKMEFEREISWNRALPGEPASDLRRAPTW
jgi:hypothetical protein